MAILRAILNFLAKLQIFVLFFEYMRIFLQFCSQKNMKGTYFAVKQSFFYKIKIKEFMLSMCSCLVMQA